MIPCPNGLIQSHTGCLCGKFKAPNTRAPTILHGIRVHGVEDALPPDCLPTLASVVTQTDHSTHHRPLLTRELAMTCSLVDWQRLVTPCPPPKSKPSQLVRSRVERVTLSPSHWSGVSCRQNMVPKSFSSDCPALVRRDSWAIMCSVAPHTSDSRRPWLNWMLVISIAHAVWLTIPASY